MYNRLFIKRLRHFMILNNVSERAMSVALGHSPTYINKIAKGLIRPKLPFLSQVCEYFNVTPAQFWDEQRQNPDIINNIEQELVSFDRNKLEGLYQLIKSL